MYIHKVPVRYISPQISCFVYISHLRHKSYLYYNGFFNTLRNKDSGHFDHVSFLITLGGKNTSYSLLNYTGGKIKCVWLNICTRNNWHFLIRYNQPYKCGRVWEYPVLGLPADRETDDNGQVWAGCQCHPPGWTAAAILPQDLPPTKTQYDR